MDKPAVTAVDNAPSTPILPEDAPDGVPPILLVEIPLGATIVVPTEDNDDV